MTSVSVRRSAVGRRTLRNFGVLLTNAFALAVGASLLSDSAAAATLIHAAAAAAAATVLHD